MTKISLPLLGTISLLILLIVGGFSLLRGEQPISQTNVLPPREYQIRSSPTKTSDQSIYDSSPDQFGSFESSPILKEAVFINSKGEGKKFIILDTKQNMDVLPIVNSYITDNNLSQKTAVNIPLLSGSTSVLRYAITDPESVSISASTGTGRTRKFIVVSSSPDGFIVLLDENGQVISEEVSENILPLLKGKCQCALDFGGWKSQDQFYVIANTAMGFYRVLINAATGKSIGAIEEIEQDSRTIY